MYSKLILKILDICWVKVGPPNRYCYEVMDTKNVPHTIERFISLFQSNKIFSLLQKYTDLELACAKASMKFELQRWTPGCYSVSNCNYSPIYTVLYKKGCKMILIFNWYILLFMWPIFLHNFINWHPFHEMFGLTQSIRDHTG